MSRIKTLLQYNAIGWILLSTLLLTAKQIHFSSVEPKILLYSGMVLSFVTYFLYKRKLTLDTKFVLLWTLYLLSLSIPLVQYNVVIADVKTFLVYVVIFGAIVLVPTVFDSELAVSRFIDYLLIVSGLFGLAGILIYLRFEPAIQLGLVFQPVETYFPDRLRPRRARGFYVSASAYGGWLLLTVFFGFMRTITSVGRQRIKYAALTLAILAAIILTNSRGVVGALLVGVVTYLFIFVGKKNASSEISAVKTIGAIVGGFLILVAVSMNLSGFNIVGRFVGILQGDHLSSVYIRLDIWKRGVEIFTSRPLFGVGIGRFDVFVFEVGDRFAGNPHNVFIQWLAETGFVSTVLVIAMITASIGMAVRTLLNQHGTFQYQYSSAVVPAMVAFFAENQFGSSYRYASPLFLFWMLLAITRSLHVNRDDGET